MREHLVRWLVLSLVGGAWLVLIPSDAWGDEPVVAWGVSGVTATELVGALLLVLAWLGLMARVLQRARVWRSDALTNVFVGLAIAGFLGAVASGLMEQMGMVVGALVVKVSAQVAIAVRVDRLVDGRSARVTSYRPSLRGTPRGP